MQKMIKEKIKLLEKKTGNAITIKEDNILNFNACVDFANWVDMTKMPKILHRKNLDKVHILHELIHLEKIFVDQYSLIATNDTNLHRELDIFKNIPEDYVAHKILSYEYGLEPIDRKWFAGKDNLRLPDNKIAANLVNFYAFSEFCTEYKDMFDSFKRKCRQNKVIAYSMAERAIEALDKMNYTEKDSYNKCAGKIIRIFAWNYYNTGKIYLSFLSKEKNKWHWNP